MLVTAGGKRPCEELSAAGAILEEWKEACSVVGAQLPDESDSPLSVKTGGIDFPGLHLTSKAKIGAKLVQEPSPRYEFVLIGDEQTVTGLPPVTWVYNKLTGAGRDGEKSGNNSSTSSLTTISLTRQQTEKQSSNQMHRFRSKSSFLPFCSKSCRPTRKRPKKPVEMRFARR